MELRARRTTDDRLRQLDELDEPVARESGEAQARSRELVQVAVVELVAVTMPLRDFVAP